MTARTGRPDRLPLPDIGNGRRPEQHAGRHRQGPGQLRRFKTTVDGKPVATQVEQKATLKGKDVSAQVRAAGLPLNLAAGDGYEALQHPRPPEGDARQGRHHRQRSDLSDTAMGGANALLLENSISPPARRWRSCMATQPISGGLHIRKAAPKGRTRTWPSATASIRASPG